MDPATLNFLLAREITRLIVEDGLTVYRRFYEQRPRLVITLTALAGVIVVGALATVISVGQAQFRAAEQRRLANLDLQRQLDQLGSVEKELQGLLQFVDDQRKRVAQTQDLIDQLEQERAELEPLVLANRETVDALLRAQQQAANRSRWADIGIGAVLGLVGNFVIALLFSPMWFPRLERLIRRAEISVAGEEDQNTNVLASVSQSKEL